MNGILETDAAPDGDIPRTRGKSPDCPTILTLSLLRAIARASVARSPNRAAVSLASRHDCMMQEVEQRRERLTSGRLADNPGSQMRSRKLEVFP
jgi:hypothetical protein